MKIQFFSAGLFLFIHASFYHLFMLTKLLWIMNESFCSSLLTRKTIHLLSITMLLFVTNFMLHNGVPVAHWQPPFRKKRALLWNFSSFFKLNCTSRFLKFKLLISLTCCSKNRFISVQLTSSQRSIMWSIKNTMTTVVHYLMQLINAFKICFEIIFPLLSET